MAITISLTGTSEPFANGRHTLDVGNGKQLIFVEMKMLHWPDSMAAPHR
ncbi:hypothetical protein O9929_14420 [Vibrio lentus]|nr:hypothetical protein [Vibrio lentus]